MSQSNVYMVDFRSADHSSSTIQKIRQLLEVDAFKSIFSPQDLTAIKIHFGEKGNDGFISPVYVRQTVDFLKAKGANPFITDTNTLYKGSRANSVDHLRTAIEHGFDYAVVNAPLVIADGLKSTEFNEVEIHQKQFKSVKIASAITDADSMLVLSHFKGHEMAGFGGAIKNLAMGCAPVSGKMEQHSARPFVRTDACIGCGRCVEMCEWNAYTLGDGVSSVQTDKCVGCGKCLGICPAHAILLNWETDISQFVERLTEYAYGAIADKQNKVLFMNFLMNITPACDCYGFSDAPIVPNIGILISTDPVAIDQASYDLVNSAVCLQKSALFEKTHQQADKFRTIYPYVDGTIQLQYGQTLKMGFRNYQLIPL